MRVLRRLLPPVVSACILLSVAPAAGAATNACDGDAEVIEQQGSVRVMQVLSDQSRPNGEFLQNWFVACDEFVGAWRTLAKTDIDASLDLVRISGRYVGFAISYTCVSCEQEDSVVGVINAQFGGYPYFRHVTDEGARLMPVFTVTDMVLKPNGSVAFIMNGNWRSKWRQTHTVIKHDYCTGTRILDSSRRHVRTQSLKLEGSTLRWRHARRLETAPLC